MANNLNKAEYLEIKAMLSKHNPTMVHRRLRKSLYRGITTVRQINKSKDWQDYTKTYWKHTKERPQYSVEKPQTAYTFTSAWKYQPYKIMIAKRETIWDRIRKLF